MAKVSVIVVSLNGKRFLSDCLNSLRLQTHPSFEVILVDNGSSDGSVAFVREFFPEVRLVCNPANVGFAAGNQAGIAISTGEFIATLNNDTIADSHWLEELVRPLESDPSLGSCASKILFHQNPGVINSAGISVDVLGIAWDRKGGEADAPEDEPSEVFGACACAAAYRKKMLDEIGGFDNDFFAYLEDVDLAWRARLAGWHSIYVPAAKVLHHHSATSIEGSPFKSRLLGRNKIWTVLKNYPLPQLLLFLPPIIAFDILAASYSVVVLRDGAALWGRLEGLRSLNSVRRKRREVQRRKKVRWSQLRLGGLESPFDVLRRFRHLNLGQQTTVRGGARRI